MQGGVSYLSQMYQQFGNWFQALEAYNAGPGAVSSGNVPSSSQTYATGILAASGVPSGIPTTTPLATSDTGLPASLDSGILDFSGSGTSFGGSDTVFWLGAALLGIGLLWWAKG